MARQNEKREIAVREIDERMMLETMEGLKLTIPPDEIPYALERILDEKHLREVMELLAAQFREKARVLKDEMVSLLELKIAELGALSRDSQHKREVLERLRDGGSLD